MRCNEKNGAGDLSDSGVFSWSDSPAGGGSRVTALSGFA